MAAIPFSPDLYISLPPGCLRQFPVELTQSHTTPGNQAKPPNVNFCADLVQITATDRADDGASLLMGFRSFRAAGSSRNLSGSNGNQRSGREERRSAASVASAIYLSKKEEQRIDPLSDDQHRPKAQADPADEMDLLTQKETLQGRYAARCKEVRFSSSHLHGVREGTRLLR